MKLRMNKNACSSLGMLQEMDGEANVHKQVANVKCQRVKMDESSVPALEDDSNEVQHMLEEPKTENISVDGVLCFSRDSSSKAPDIDFSYGLDCGLKTTRSGLGTRNVQAQYDFEFGVLDGFLDDVDEVDDIHAANDISGACENFLLDVELADQVTDLDFAPCEAFQLANISPESQSPGFSGSSSAANGLSESSTATVTEPECKNCSLGHMVKCELHVLSGDKWHGRTPADDNNFHSECDFKNLHGFRDDAKPPLGGIIDENETKFIEAIKGDTLLGQKRLRRPTKRYIEEFADPKSKHVSDSEVLTSAVSKDKFSKIIASNEEYHGASAFVSKEETIQEIITEATSRSIEELLGKKAKPRTVKFKTSVAVSKDERLKKKFRNEHGRLKLKCAAVEESFTGSSPQAQSESRPRRGRPRKCTPLPVLESDDEETASDSKDDCVKKKSKKGGDRRKHQRMWTLSEVTKLIDGVAQFGTGRWTDIKNLLFSSSAYRTPIDLRDKWRNLLRASNAQKQKQNKKEVEQKLKHAMRPLPKSVVRRICELSSIHPYPRFTPGGRYTRRKN